MAETPCTHEHTEDCYSFVTACVHAHTDQCYPADAVSGSADTSSDLEKVQPTACTHLCSEESRCITMTLDCQHEHDAKCGYSPAAEGAPCTFVCEVCNPQGGDKEQCSCHILCTEDMIDMNCPVCQKEGISLSVCMGEPPSVAEENNDIIHINKDDGENDSPDVRSTLSGTPTVIAGHGGIDPDTYIVTAQEGYAINQLFIDGVNIPEAYEKSTYTPASLPESMMFVEFSFTAIL